MEPEVGEESESSAAVWGRGVIGNPLNQPSQPVDYKCFLEKKRQQACVSVAFR
jgi:hypothetical protein